MPLDKINLLLWIAAYHCQFKPLSPLLSHLQPLELHSAAEAVHHLPGNPAQIYVSSFSLKFMSSFHQSKLLIQFRCN